MITMTPHIRIAIVGSGIGGAALALFLDKAGLRPSLFEAAPAGLGVVGSGLQIAPNGMNILAQLGLADALIARGSVATTMRFRNAQGTLLCDATFQQPERWGHPAVNATRHDVHGLLVGELHRRGIPIHFSKRLADLDDSGAVAILRFEDGTEVTADIVVGADGIHSRVRRALMPDGPSPEYTGLVSAGGFVDPAVLERVPPPATLEMIYGKVGFFGMGLVNERRDACSVLWWSALPVDAMPRERIAAMTDAERRRMLLEVHRGWCTPVETAIRRSSSPIFIDNIYDIRRLPVWHRGRVVLMGDAAHAVSPHSGQGASMALEDAIVLAGHLRDRIDSPAEAFSRFETDRRSRVEKIVQMGRRSGNQKRPLGPVGAWARDRFVSLALPSVMRLTAGSLYNYRPAWKERAA
jgi:2-polyprenyl-6-methoxyphenol hydroxylase-like FAD-dependent oxidoreductase